MQKEIKIEPCVDSYLRVENSETIPSCPELYLIAAVLERSYRDLFLEDRHNIKAAIAWFKGIEAPSMYVTFEKCTTYLDLSAKNIEEIKYAVDLSIKYLHDPSSVLAERDRLKQRNNYRQNY